MYHYFGRLAVNAVGTTVVDAQFSYHNCDPLKNLAEEDANTYLVLILVAFFPGFYTLKFLVFMYR